MRAEDVDTERTANHPPPNIQKKKTRKKGKFDLYGIKLKLTIVTAKTILDPQQVANEKEGELLIVKNPIYTSQPIIAGETTKPSAIIEKS